MVDGPRLTPHSIFIPRNSLPVGVHSASDTILTRALPIRPKRGKFKENSTVKRRQNRSGPKKKRDKRVCSRVFPIPLLSLVRHAFPSCGDPELCKRAALFCRARRGLQLCPVPCCGSAVQALKGIEVHPNVLSTRAPLMQ